MRTVDLHIHTSNSDGEFSGEELLVYLDKNNIEFASFTDHNFLTEVQSNNFNVNIISGVEYYAYYDNYEIHILGYGVKNNDAYKEYIANVKKVQKQNVVRILHYLSKKNVKISKEFYDKKKVDLGVIAQGIVEYGYAKNINEAFEKYIYEILLDAKFNVGFDYKTVIDSIVNSSGIAVWAHPFSSISDEKMICKMLMEFNKCGLKGIEAYYLGHSENEKMLLEEMATELKLVFTGGSDFHGNRKKQEVNQLKGIQLSNQIIDDFLELIY